MLQQPPHSSETMSTSKPVKISNPQRMLVVGASDAGVLEFIADLTTTAPVLADNGSDTTIAGLTHAWTLITPYYTTTIPIWIDDITDVAAWRAEFSKPEASEVVAAVGAWVYVFRKPLRDQEDKDKVLRTMESIRDVIAKGSGAGWDGLCLAVAVKGTGLVKTSDAADLSCIWGVEQWEDAARERGFEYVDAEAKGRNEFGEVQGMARVREALESNVWDGEDTADADWDSTITALDEVVSDVEEQAAQVDELEWMMSSLGGIRDMAAGMPLKQRKRLVVKANSDLMKSA